MAKFKCSAWAARAGATRPTLHTLSLGAAVVGTNKKAFFGHANKSRVIVTLTKTL